jgi:hypothetical protein
MSPILLQACRVAVGFTPLAMLISTAQETRPDAVLNIDFAIRTITKPELRSHSLAMWKPTDTSLKSRDEVRMTNCQKEQRLTNSNRTKTHTKK